MPLIGEFLHLIRKKTGRFRKNDSSQHDMSKFIFPHKKKSPKKRRISKIKFIELRHEQIYIYFVKKQDRRIITKIKFVA